MATKIHMEALSPTMEEGQIARWLKAEGDAVTEGDVIAEVETDKATMELVARGAGILRKILLPQGGTTKVGDVIGVIAAKDEDISALTPNAAPAAAAPTAPAAAAPAPPAPAAPAPPAAPATPAPAVPQADALPATPVMSSPASPAPTTATSPDARVKASPLARRIATDRGIDLAAVAGSGPNGRVIQRDLAGSSGSAASPSNANAGVARSGAEFTDVAASQTRKAIARRLVQSIGPVPTFYLTTEVDMAAMSSVRGKLNDLLAAEKIKISFNDLVVKAVAMALKKHPEVNASWQENSVRQWHVVHMGVAVAIEDGLITPIVRDADQKSVVDISQEVRELAGRAREKRLKPEEYTGATFSISNLGMFDIEHFTAIINPPEAAILAVGSVRDVAVALNGEVAIRPRMRVTLSCDHRVIDGATGAKFLQQLKQYLEEPALMALL